MSRKRKYPTDDWTGLYRKGWKGHIDDEAFKHPAKFARGLVAKIYDHCRDEGWLVAGDLVVDPFGGVALGGFDAMRLGLHWVGVELEPAFVRMGNLNIDLWNYQHAGKLPRWGSARLVRGDSRNLAALVGRCAGQAISSPPFLQTRGGVNTHTVSGPLADPRLIKRHSAGNLEANGYGQAGGQLANLQEGSIEAALVASSPPYDSTDQNYAAGWQRFHKGHTPVARYDAQREAAYGTSDGQVAGAEDFWTASRVIIQQTYDVLRPGGHACWVVKGFIRKGKLVDFPDQWRRLCEAVGFQTVHLHRAQLGVDLGRQLGHGDQADVSKSVTRKSFFRRMLEEKGAPPIDYETVLCMVKPE